MQITIKIPESSQCILKVGEEVEFGSPFLKKEELEDVSFSLSDKLHVAPSKIFHYVKKFVGDPVQKGDILAVKKGFFSTSKVVSEYDGVLKEVNHTDGTLVITHSKEKAQTTPAFFKGHVVTKEKDHVIIKVKSGKEYPLKHAEKDFGGETYYIETIDNMNVSSGNVEKKVIITESLTDYFQTKFEAVGVSGFVSLNKLGEQVTVPVALIKTIEDFKKIHKEKFPYCFIDSHSSTITFYT